jgi:hypothetical protein
MIDGQKPVIDRAIKNPGLPAGVIERLETTPAYGRAKVNRASSTLPIRLLDSCKCALV